MKPHQAEMIIKTLFLLFFSIGCNSQAPHFTRAVPLKGLSRDRQPQCVTDKGPVRLRSNSASPCTVQRLNHKTLRILNPHDAPEKYPNGVTCEATLSTAAPRYLRVNVKKINFQKTDRVVIKGPFRFRAVINMTRSERIYVPSTYAKVYFTTKDKKRNVVRVNVASKSNSCQRVCKLAFGDTGAIKHGLYTENTFCEWWLEAPAECIIRLRFVKFEVGAPGGEGAWTCPGDYVGVDRGGDPTYAHPNSRTFCGSTLPRGIRSVANKLNVLFNGREGGYEGFRAIYKVFCPSDNITDSATTLQYITTEEDIAITEEVQLQTTESRDPPTTHFVPGITTKKDIAITEEVQPQTTKFRDPPTTRFVPGITTKVEEVITTPIIPDIPITTTEKETQTTINDITTTVLYDIMSTTVHDETRPITIAAPDSSPEEGDSAAPPPPISAIQDDFFEEDVDWDADEWQDEWDDGWEVEDYDYEDDEEEVGEAWGEGWGEEDYDYNYDYDYDYESANE